MKTRIKLNSKKIKKYSGRKKNSRFKHKKYSKLRGGANTLVSSLLNNKSYIPHGEEYKGNYTGVSYEPVPESKGLETTQSPEFKATITRYYDAIAIFNCSIRPNTICNDRLKDIKEKYIKNNVYIEIIEIPTYFKIIFWENSKKTKTKTIETIYIYYTVRDPIQFNVDTRIYTQLNKNSVRLKTPILINHKIYVVKEQTNQNITVETDPKIQSSYSITPLDLNVATMQSAINTKSLEVVKDRNNTYLSFQNNFPCLVIKEILFSFKSSRVGSQWISVYEDSSFKANRKFKIPYHKNYDKMYEENFVFEQIIFSNIDLFRHMRAKVISLLSKLKSDTNTNTESVLLLELDKLYKHVMYCFSIKIDKNNHIIQEDGTEIIDTICTENINWVLKNSLWLEQYLKIKTVDNSLKANQLLELIGKEYDSDLSGLDEKYIIVDEFENKVENGDDGKNYVICGYPEAKTKEHILNFWQLNAQLNNDLTEHIANLFDKSQKNEIDKIDYKNNKKNKLYNLYSRLRNIIKDYEMNRFKEIEFKNDTEQYELFKTQFLNNYNSYYQQIALKYLKKPMLFIKYVFFVFKKESDGKLVPMVFNIKELNQIHQPILKRVDKLIKKELSYRFGILDDDEYNNKSLLFDDEYKLWYSGFTIGNMFHISTEYVHTMSNISRKAHYYLNFKTLEEIIYSCVLLSKNGNNFLKDIKFNYQVREYKINNYKKKLQINNTKEILPNRTENIFALYEEDKLLKQFYKENILKEEEYKQDTFNLWKINQVNMIQFNYWKKEIQEKQDKKEKEKKPVLTKKLENKDISNMIFILMFKSSNQEYTFIYLLNGEYYKLVIKSIMTKIIDQIIMQLHILNEHKNTITFTNLTPLFSIVSNDLLDTTFLSLNIFRYNPLIYYRNTAFFNGFEKLNPNNYFETQMIKDTKQILNYGYSLNFLKPINSKNSSLQTNNKSNSLVLLNIFNQIPILVQNFLLNDYYIKMVKLHDDRRENEKKQDTECNTVIKYDDKFPPCDKELNCSPQESINCVYINIGNCGYNFVEKIDNSANKLVVYIVPYGMEINKEDNTNNFEEYKDSRNSRVKYPFLSNNRDLDDRSIPMLTELLNLYVNNKKILCFLHQTSNAVFMCLHFHIIPEDEYRRRFPKEEVGIYISQSIDVNTLINNLTLNSDYYKNSNFSLIRQQ